MSITAALSVALFYGFYASQPFILLMGPSNFGAIIGLIIGFFMKDPTTGVMVGAWIQIMYLGMVNYGGTKPSDQFAASVTAIPLAISTHAPLGITLMIASLFGSISFPLDKTWKKINTIFWNPRIDKYVEDLNFQGIALSTSIYPLLVRVIISVPAVFVIDYYGATLIQKFLTNGPAFLVNSLNNAGLMLPALGIALFLTSIGRKNQFPYFAFGYLLLTLINIPNLMILVLSLILAALSYFISENKSKKVSSQ